MPANSTGRRWVGIATPKTWTLPAPHLAIAAYVVADGKYLGQITEAVVDIKGAESY